MGWSFSNFQVKKAGETTQEDLKQLLYSLLKPQKKRGFSLFRQKEKPGSGHSKPYSIYDPGGDWISVSADDEDFTCQPVQDRLCRRIAEQLGTQVLAITCIDSDCLLLRLIDPGDGTDAWAQLGIMMDFEHPSQPEAWKEKVKNPEVWEELLDSDWAFIEEALPELEPQLGLVPGQGMFCPELIPERYAANSERIIF